jgi:branched-chain amino acid transport system ATP-binding protein
MKHTLLNVLALGVHFGALKSVDKVSFSIAEGERVAILGPNGAGKTTLFNAITGMHVPTLGNIHFLGKDITNTSPNYRANLGMARTFQITNLFFGLSVEENLLLALRALQPVKMNFWRAGKTSDSEKVSVDHALDLCHLSPKRALLVKEISYGEQRQLELAMSLMSSPKILLLDEPAAGLSPADRVIMANVISELPRNIAIILIEHDINLALSLVERVICMYQGSILVEGRPDEIRNNKTVQEVYLGKARDVKH